MEKALTFLERRWHRFTELPQLCAPAPARHGLAIACIVKHEEHYIREWIAFHRIVGVRHFYIYVNDDTAAMSAVTQDFEEAGLVTLVPWENFNTSLPPQPSAYAHALANFGPDYRWMAFIDPDEFLFPLKGSDLLGTLADFEDLPGISVPWHMFGTSGHVVRPDGLVLENYIKRAPFPATDTGSRLLQYKSIVDPARIKSVKNGHWFYTEGDIRAAFTEQRRKLNLVTEQMPIFARSDVFRLNHYFTRSAEEVDAKIARGRIDRSSAAARASHKFSQRTRVMCDLIERSAQYDTEIHRFLPVLRQALGQPKAAKHDPVFLRERQQADQDQVA